MRITFVLMIAVFVYVGKCDATPQLVGCDFPREPLPPSTEPQRRRSLSDSVDRCNEMAVRIMGASVDYDENNVPKLSSKPGSTNVAYLDFDGHVASNTIWTNGEGRLTALPYHNHTLPFSDNVRDYIWIYWCTIAEDFMPFDIDVTTIAPAIFNATTARILFTPNFNNDTNDRIFEGNFGGVAYVDVWGLANYHTYYSPALVFSSAEGTIQQSPGWASYEYILLPNIGGIGSHELGHNLGLSHHGRNNDVYADPINDWSPIMGSSMYTSTWSNGQYTNATNPGQDDIQIIYNKLNAFRDDEQAAIVMTTNSAYGTINYNTGNNTISETDLYIYNITANSGLVQVEVKSVYNDDFVSNGKFGLSVKFTHTTTTRNNECETQQSNAVIVIDTQNNAGYMEITVRATFNTEKVTSAYEMSGSYVLSVEPSLTATIPETICSNDVTVLSYCKFDSCKNGGTCPEKSDTENYTCSCTREFTGSTCETILTPTTSTPTTTSSRTTSTPTTSTRTTSTPTTSTRTTSTTKTSTRTTSTTTTSTLTMGYSVESGTVQCTGAESNTTRRAENGKLYTKRSPSDFLDLIARKQFSDIATSCSSGLSQMENLLADPEIFKHDISGLDLQQVSMATVFTPNTTAAIDQVYNLCLPKLTKNQSDHIFITDPARQWIWKRVINRSCDCLQSPCGDGNCFNGSPKSYKCICLKNQTGNNCENRKSTSNPQRKIFRISNISIDAKFLSDLKSLFSDEFEVHLSQIQFETSSKRRNVESSLLITITDMNIAQTNRVESFIQNPEILTADTVFQSIQIEDLQTVVQPTSTKSNTIIIALSVSGGVLLLIIGYALISWKESNSVGFTRLR